MMVMIVYYGFHVCLFYIFEGLLSTQILPFFNVCGLEYFKGKILKKAVDIMKRPNITAVTRGLVSYILFVKNLVILLNLLVC